MEYFTLLSLSLALLLGATSFFHVIRHAKRPSPSQSRRAPPSPRGLPIIGHLHHLTSMPHHSFSRLADQLGPIFLLRLGRVPTLVISSARLARLVLKTHDHVFASRPQLVAAQYLSFGCSDVTFSPLQALLAPSPQDMRQRVALPEASQLVPSRPCRGDEPGSESPLNSVFLQGGHEQGLLHLSE